MNERPTGIVIVSIVIIIEVALTFLTIFQDFDINLVIGLFDLVTIIFGLIAVYGLLNLKPWGWIAGIAYAIYDIIVSALAAFFFADLFAESIKSLGLNVDVYKSDLLFGFIFALILDLIIIYYVYSQKEYFIPD